MQPSRQLYVYVLYMCTCFRGAARDTNGLSIEMNGTKTESAGLSIDMIIVRALPPKIRP